MTYHEYCIKEKKEFLKMIEKRRFIVLQRCSKCKCPILIFCPLEQMNMYMSEVSYVVPTSLGTEILCAECSSENVLFGYNHFEHNQYLLKMTNFHCMDIAKLENGIPIKHIYIDLINDKFCSFEPFFDINFEDSIKQQIIHDFKIANYFLLGT